MSVSPLIIAHRGASAHAPENTLSAFRMAVDAGADGIEFDVQLAKDGVPVVIHDPRLDRTGLRSGNVSDFTSKELAEFDVGTWFNAKYPKRSNSDFARESIPTLTQTLQMLETFCGLIYIELKTDKADFHKLTKAVCDIVRDSPLFARIILKSFTPAAIPDIRHQLPDVQTAALFGHTIMDLLRRRQTIITIAGELGADQISLHHSLVTPKLISLATAAQLPVTIWTTDKPKWLSRCRKLGIRALITNDPIKLLNVEDKIDFWNKKGG